MMRSTPSIPGWLNPLNPLLRSRFSRCEPLAPLSRRVLVGHPPRQPPGVGDRVVELVVGPQPSASGGRPERGGVQRENGQVASVVVTAEHNLLVLRRVDRLDRHHAPGTARHRDRRGVTTEA